MKNKDERCKYHNKYGGKCRAIYNKLCNGFENNCPTAELLDLRYENEALKIKNRAFNKQLHNNIIQWENLYGYWYTLLYDEKGKQRPEEINNDLAYEALKSCGNILNVLRRLDRNKHYDLTKMTKKKYKIRSGYTK